MARRSAQERLRSYLLPVPGRAACTHAKAFAFWLNGGNVSIRVAVWTLGKGRRPKGKLISTCGTRMCCTLGHLRDAVGERGKIGGDRSPSRPSRDNLLRLQDRDFDVSTDRWLSEPCCPVCGAPPVFGTCIICVPTPNGNERPAAATMPLRRAA